MRVFSEQAKQNPFQMTLEVALLITVLGILSLFLLSFVVPTTDKESSKKTACLSNVKQISLSVTIYEADNNDYLPPYFTFEGESQSKGLMASLRPYLKNRENVFTCPADLVVMNQLKSGAAGVNPMSYVNCLSLKKLIPHFADGNRSINVSKDIQSPALTGYLRDPVRGLGTVKDSKGVEHQNAIMSPHEDGFAVAYFDGHVKRIRIPNRKTEL